MSWPIEQVAALAASDIPDGSYVNLGIGLPELVANYLPPDREIVLHSENGILGMGPCPADDAIDTDLINAGKKPITLLPGGAYFHHADSFAMIRGGYVDLCILGAFEVAATGDIANWTTGGSGIPAVGGAMDLIAGARSVRVITRHTTTQGAPKLVGALSLPATGRQVIERVYTDLGIFEPIGGAFNAVTLAPGVTREDVAARTGAPILTEELAPAT